MNASHLEDIGRTGTIKETDQANLGRAFDQIGARIEGMTARYYLLSYCTPSRAGRHEVRIEAHADKDLSGSLTYEFTADGFGPICDPSAPPDFDLAHSVVVQAEDDRKRLKVEKKTEPHPAHAPKAAATATPNPTPSATPGEPFSP
jgi:hypothetical protein